LKTIPSKDWEIFRGDSFQLVVTIEDAIVAAIHIKAVIKQTKLHDVRMGIGVGEREYISPKITESNGSAFIKSGECFESLKKSTMAIKTMDEAFDYSFNIMLDLSLLISNNWSSIVAEVIKTAIENSDKNQKELAQLLNKSQSSVSEALKRGGFEEMMNMNFLYKSQISR
jgi:predicted XRE-type DNA-binding protein